MSMSFRQEARQVQKQVQKQRMIQAMEILQLPTQALQEKIQQELQENPTLDLLEDAPEPEDGLWEQSQPPEPRAADDGPMDIGQGNENADFNRVDDMSEDLRDFNDDDYRPSQSYIEDLNQRRTDMFANIQARQETLQEYLQSQLFWGDLEKPLQEAVEQIIFNLDDHGFLQTALQDLFPPDDAAEMALAQRALAVVQSLDPTGVGARNLQECLLLQLDPEDPDCEYMQQLISEHLTDIENNRLPLVARKMDLTLDELDVLLQRLRRMNPDPGREFRKSAVSTVVPDVYCAQQEDGRYVVSLDENMFPPLCVNMTYRPMLRDKNVEKDARGYIRKKMSAAQWLIESIQQRQNTLLRVSQAIVDYQKDFLDVGPEGMRPLKMEQIAKQLDIHFTTVSRAVDGKWIQTPRGIFPLRRFFVSGVSQQKTEDGEEEVVARDAILAKIREIVENEDKAHPLSDEAITAALADAGFSITRRTVVKYRKMLKIPSSRQRKIWM